MAGWAAGTTPLQRRLASEVRAGLARTGRTQADLAKATGIGTPHISLLLHGHRNGSIRTWDALIREACRIAEGLSMAVVAEGAPMAPNSASTTAISRPPPPRYVNQVTAVTKSAVVTPIRPHQRRTPPSGGRFR